MTANEDNNNAGWRNGDAVAYACAQVLESERATNRRPSFPDGTFPGYEIMEEIQRGGQGVVYKAMRLSTRQTVAIKVLRWHEVSGTSQRARFERELRVLAEMRHPNIVSLQDGGTAGEYCFLVTDFVDGDSLAQFVERKQPNTVEALQLFLKICAAINVAHQRGVIHRDLKPSNVLIDRRGEPQVIDFGLAKLSEEALGGLTEVEGVTQDGNFLGSFPWASPEQANGDSNAVDTRSDVYGLGGLLYFLLCGRPPFELSGSMSHAIEQIRDVVPTRPGSYDTSLDHDLDVIALKCLSKDRHRRYETVLDLSRDVERFLRGEAITARQDSNWYVVRKSIQRHRAVASVAAVLALSTLFYALTMTVMFRRANLAEHRAQREAEAAKEQFLVARDTIDFLIGEVTDRLNDAGRTQAIRRDILKGAQKSLQRLASISGNTLQTQRERARATSKLGSIALSLGATEEARGYFRAAMDDRQAIAHAPKSSAKDQAALSLAMVRLGDCAGDSNDAEVKLSLYESAFEIDRRLADAHPDVPHFIDNLAWSFERIGYQAMVRHDFVFALACFEKQLATAERLTQIRPGPQSLWAEVRALAQLQEMANHDKDSGRAFSLFQARLQKLQRLVEAVPNNRGYRHDYCSALAVFASRAWQHGKSSVALENADRAHEMARSLHQEDPDDLRHQLTYARATTLLATIYESDKKRNPGDARRIVQDALQVMEAATLAAPTRADLWETRFALLDQYVQLSLPIWNDDETRRRGDELLDIAQHIHSSGLVTPRFLLAYSTMFLRTDPPELYDPLAAIEAARELQEMIGAEEPQGWVVLADALAAGGDAEGALEALNKALALVPADLQPIRSRLERKMRELNGHDATTSTASRLERTRP